MSTDDANVVRAREIVPTREDLAEAERILMDIGNRGHRAALWRIGALVQARRRLDALTAHGAEMQREVERLRAIENRARIFVRTQRGERGYIVSGARFDELVDALLPDAPAPTRGETDG